MNNTEKAAGHAVSVFTNKGQIIQTCAAVVSMAIAAGSFFRATAAHARTTLWVRVYVALALISSAVLAYTYQGNTVVLVASGMFAAAAMISLGRFGWISATSSTPTPKATALSILQVTLEKADQPHIEHKRKLRIIVKNMKKSVLILGPGTTWVKGDLDTRALPQQVWEVEPADGWRSGRWTHQESGQVRLKPGQAARTWVSVHSEATQAEIDALAGRLGALHVPVATPVDEVFDI